ncbi:hypothetical protein M0638_07695 [Roseomonas sp. NAR14]|uniref:Uncharacterized protein n=1 Tax=Roseomonas acroporae TaxID=2937791 RepID=A0A9X2BVR9_9PROT|nr:hypothetical protein [Roseomonas acroporae]MCK8784259.1 hypothetical protein [Roseomonas acroporae]
MPKAIAKSAMTAKVAHPAAATDYGPGPDAALCALCRRANELRTTIEGTDNYPGTFDDRDLGDAMAEWDRTLKAIEATPARTAAGMRLKLATAAGMVEMEAMIESGRGKLGDGKAHEVFAVRMLREAQTFMAQAAMQQP